MPRYQIDTLQWWKTWATYEVEAEGEAEAIAIAKTEKAKHVHHYHRRAGDDKHEDILDVREAREEDELPAWVDSHSVNCCRCGDLFDERNSIGHCDDDEGAGWGDICPKHERKPQPELDALLASLGPRSPIADKLEPGLALALDLARVEVPGLEAEIVASLTGDLTAAMRGKARLWAIFKELGLYKVCYSYSGSGDEGMLEEVLEVEHDDPAFDFANCSIAGVFLDDLLQEIGIRLLPAGWDQGEGSYGTMTFQINPVDPEELVIVIQHEDCYIETTSSVQVF